MGDQEGEEITATETPVGDTDTTELTYIYSYGSTEPTEAPVDMMVPDRSSVIEFDWEETPLEIRTTSSPGSGDQIRVRFLTEDRNQAGNLKIKFDNPPSYFIPGCMNSKKEFELPSSEDGEYIWRVTKADGRIIVHCNGEEVINVSYADSAKAACREMWSKDTEAIEFMGEDNASDGFRARRTRGGKGKRKRKGGKGKGKGRGKGKGKNKGDKSKDGSDTMEKDYIDQEGEEITATETPVGDTDTTELTYIYSYGSTEPTEAPVDHFSDMMVPDRSSV